MHPNSWQLSGYDRITLWFGSAVHEAEVFQRQPWKTARSFAHCGPTVLPNLNGWRDRSDATTKESDAGGDGFANSNGSSRWLELLPGRFSADFFTAMAERYDVGRNVESASWKAATGKTTRILAGPGPQAAAQPAGASPPVCDGATLSPAFSLPVTQERRPLAPRGS